MPSWGHLMTPKGPPPSSIAVGTGAPAWELEARARVCGSQQTLRLRSSSQALRPGKPTWTRQPGVRTQGGGGGLLVSEARAAGLRGQALGWSLNPTLISPATSGKPPDLECGVTVLPPPEAEGLLVACLAPARCSEGLGPMPPPKLLSEISSTACLVLPAPSPGVGTPRASPRFNLAPPGAQPLALILAGGRPEHVPWKGEPLAHQAPM